MDFALFGVIGLLLAPVTTTCSGDAVEPLRVDGLLAVDARSVCPIGDPQDRRFYVPELLYIPSDLGKIYVYEEISDRLLTGIRDPIGERTELFLIAFSELTLDIGTQFV